MSDTKASPEPEPQPLAPIEKQGPRRPTVSLVRGPKRPAEAAASPPPPALPPAGEPPSPRAPASFSGFSPGDRVSHYELIRLLGRGGMGEVWQARDDRLGRRVAIKFLQARDGAEATRFITEGQATARCAHENIITIHEVGDVNGLPFMVLELLQGNPLSKLIADRKPMAPARAVDLMVPVLRALVLAHERGIIHRDLKPDNVFVTAKGTVKVLDFGIAKPWKKGDAVAPQAPAPLGRLPSEHDLASRAPSLTLHGSVLGSPPWMSPEQWRGEAAFSSDLWAVGVMLFRMVTGRHPVEGASGMQYAVVAQKEHRMPPVRSVAPGIPVELARIIDRCLQKEVEQRFPDAASLLEALDPLLPSRQTRILELDANPYAGLSPFQESDADRFFGRDREIGVLLSCLRDQPFTAIVGPSGIGKSSFVRAGAIPALKRSGDAWEAVVIRPGRTPLAALASCIASMAASESGSGTSATTTVAADLQQEQGLVDRLRAEPGYAGMVARKYARREKRNLLVFVDQLEELYTLVPDERERLELTACLAGIADDASSPTRVVVSIRSDFLDRVTEDPDLLAELTRGLFFLGVPSREGLRDALVQPALLAGYRFEKESIVEEMLAHLQMAPGALPLLQFAASQLWEGRDRDHKVFTEASYAGLGGIAGALARHADNVLAELSQEYRELAKTLFLRLVTPEHTHAILSMDELREGSRGTKIERLVQQLAQARLLVIRKNEGGATTAEIVHESLITSWPTFRRWLDESGEDAAFFEQVRAAAKQWQAKNRDADLLWRGELAQDARRFQKRFQGELTPVQHDFLQAVFAQEARAAKRKHALMLGGVIFLMVLVGAASVALVVIRRAQVAAVKAESEARQNLQVARASEAERAEAARRAEEASVEAERRAEQLAVASKQKDEALRQAEEDREKAEASEREALRANELARSKKEQAEKAARDLRVALGREQKRRERIEKQLGSFGLLRIDD